MKDYHYILGVKKGASKDEIKQAFRKLSKKIHPDVNDGDKYFEERFKEIREAYDALIKENEAKSSINKTSIKPPKIIEFLTSKNVLCTGEIVTIRWKVFNADKVHINLFGEVGHFGEKNIKFNNATAEKEIKIIATNIKSKTSKSLVIKVNDVQEKSSESNSKLYAPIVLLMAIALISFMIYFLISQADNKKSFAQNSYPKSNYNYQPINYSYPKTNTNSSQSYQKISNRNSNLSKEDNSKFWDDLLNLEDASHQTISSTRHFAIGSSRSKVIEVQGTPSSVRKIGNRETLSYGLSDVRLENGVVSGYSNLGENLRVKSKSSNSGRNIGGHFAIGSSRSKVIEVQGTPSSVRKIGNRETLSYGLSDVRLENGVVSGYSNLGENLRVKSKSSNSGRNIGGHFAIGSSRSKVIEVQGTPSSVRKIGNRETLSYGLSDVRLENGVVSGYSNLGENLRVKSKSSNSGRNIGGHFAIGSSRSKVIEVQGTPSSVRKIGNRETLSYGLSDVRLENGVVSGYSNLGENLRVK